MLRIGYYQAKLLKEFYPEFKLPSSPPPFFYIHFLQILQILTQVLPSACPILHPSSMLVVSKHRHTRKGRKKASSKQKDEIESTPITGDLNQIFHTIFCWVAGLPQAEHHTLLLPQAAEHSRDRQRSQMPQALPEELPPKRRVPSNTSMGT